MTGHLVLIGGDAGSVEDDAVAGVLAILAAAGPTEQRRCDDPGDVDAALAALDGRILVVAGGDGSLHVALQALDRAGLRSEVDVGLVPLGTGNDLARGAGIPLDPLAAAERVVAGRARPCDLIRAGEGLVVNAAHAGIGVAAADRAAGLKDAMGRAAYPAGALVAGAEADPLEVTVAVDGQPLADGAPLLLVGVGNGSTVGGGTALFPDADPADGLLDVVTVRDRGAWQRLRLGLATRGGDHLGLEGVRSARGREVVVTGTAAWNDDGELGGPVGGRVLRVEPGGWRLIR